MTRLALATLVAITLAVTANSCQYIVESLRFCGRMLDAQGKLVRSGTATFHVKWVTDGVEYDSDYYGAPTGKIDQYGKVYFNGGVGFTARTYNFRLVSLTVEVSGGPQGTLHGVGTNIRRGYDSRNSILYVSADFVLKTERPAGSAGGRDPSGDPNRGRNAYSSRPRVARHDQPGEREQHERSEEVAKDLD